MQTIIQPHSLLVPRMGDRQMVHALVMKALPDDLDPVAPRAAAKALWRWDPTQELLLLQAESAVRSDLLGEVVKEVAPLTVSAGERIVLSLDLCVLKCRASDLVAGPLCRS